MQILGVQFDIAWEDRAANHAKVQALLEASPPQRGPRGALVVLPEMFASGFSMNVAGLVEGSDRPSERFVASLAKDFGVHVVAGIVTPADDGRGRNEALVVNPEGAVVARYHKLHPFTPGGENVHYVAGSEVVIFDCAGMKVAPLICYDLRFPEAFRPRASRASRGGAEMFVVIASWPAARIAHWTALLRARAIENQAYVVGVNRCGRDPNFTYPGGSVVFDPSGATVAELADGEGLLIADIDPERVRSYRRELPFLDDIRDDLP